MKKLTALLFILFFAVAAYSQTPLPSPRDNGEEKPAKPQGLVNIVRQPVTVPKFTTAPVIDGKLDEEIWKKAAIIKDLIQTAPGDNIAASKPTEAYIGYDEKYFYIAFKC